MLLPVRCGWAKIFDQRRGRVCPSPAGACDGRLSSQLSDLRFEQAPALVAELVLPGRIDARKARTERRLVDLVERDPARGKSIPQAGIEPALLLALLAHIFCGVVLDHALDLVG